MQSLPRDAQQRVRIAYDGPKTHASKDPRPWAAAAVLISVAAVAADLGSLPAWMAIVAKLSMALAAGMCVLQVIRVFAWRRAIIASCLRQAWALDPVSLPLMPGWPKVGKQWWLKTELQGPGVGQGVKFTMRAAIDEWDGERNLSFSLYDPTGKELAVSPPD